jgi:hypothetical protein
MLCLEPDHEKRLPNVAVLAGELLAAVKRDDADAVRARLTAVLGGPPPDDAMRSGQYVAQSLSASIRIASTPSDTAIAQVAPATDAPSPPRRTPIIVAFALLAAFAILVGVRSIRGSGEVAAPPVAARSEAVAPPPRVEPVPDKTPEPIASAIAPPTASSASPPRPKAAPPIAAPPRPSPSAIAAPPPPPPPPEKKKPSPLEERE